MRVEAFPQGLSEGAYIGFRYSTRWKPRGTRVLKEYGTSKERHYGCKILTSERVDLARMRACN